MGCFESKSKEEQEALNRELSAHFHQLAVLIQRSSTTSSSAFSVLPDSRQQEPQENNNKIDTKIRSKKSIDSILDKIRLLLQENGANPNSSIVQENVMMFPPHDDEDEEEENSKTTNLGGRAVDQCPHPLAAGQQAPRVENDTNMITPTCIGMTSFGNAKVPSSSSSSSSRCPALLHQTFSVFMEFQLYDPESRMLGWSSCLQKQKENDDQKKNVDDEKVAFGCEEDTSSGGQNEEEEEDAAALEVFGPSVEVIRLLLSPQNKIKIRPNQQQGRINLNATATTDEEDEDENIVTPLCIAVLSGPRMLPVTKLLLHAGSSPNQCSTILQGGATGRRRKGGKNDGGGISEMEISPLMIWSIFARGYFLPSSTQQHQQQQNNTDDIIDEDQKENKKKANQRYKNDSVEKRDGEVVLHQDHEGMKFKKLPSAQLNSNSFDEDDGDEDSYNAIGEKLFAADLRLLDVLLEAGANMDAVTAQGGTSLLMSILNFENAPCSMEAVRAQLERGADPNVGAWNIVQIVNSPFFHSLGRASEPDYYYSKSKRLRATKKSDFPSSFNGNYVKNSNNRGATSKKNNDFLPENNKKDGTDGKEVSTNLQGITPLMLAVLESNWQVASLLLDYGAEVDSCNKNGMTCLMMAIVLDRMNFALLFLECKANVNLQERKREHRTALMYAVEANNKEMVALLLSPKYRVNLKLETKSGWTAVFYAAAFNHVEILQLLLEQTSVDIFHKSRSGLTAYDVVGTGEGANRSRSGEVKKLLREKMSQVNPDGSPTKQAGGRHSRQDSSSGGGLLANVGVNAATVMANQMQDTQFAVVNEAKAIRDESKHCLDNMVFQVREEVQQTRQEIQKEAQETRRKFDRMCSIS